MKAALHIPVTGTTGKPLHLLIEAGNQSLSFFWFHQSPDTLAGLSVYHLGQPLTASVWASLINAEKDLLRPVDSVSVFFDVKESTLVPTTFFSEGFSATMLDNLYGSAASASVRTIESAKLQATLVYRVPPDLIQGIVQTFPGATFRHSTVPQIDMLSEKPAELFAFFSHQAIKIFLFQHGELQYVQYAGYQTASDACYHLLNTCHQHGKSPADLRVQVSGMIEKRSSLFNELYTCFPSIHFEEPGSQWQMPEDVSAYPFHYFSHLTELASCVS